MRIVADSLGFSIAAVAIASVGVGGVAWLLSCWLAGRSRRRLGRGDQLALIWLLYNATIHFTLVRVAGPEGELSRDALCSSAGSLLRVPLPPRNCRVFRRRHG